MDSKLFLDLLLECDEFLMGIHTAANIGCDERVRDIIENSDNKCIVDEQNKNGWTPLMYAACCANLKVVLLLLEEGAETDLRNSEGHTALTLASKCGSGDVVHLLIDSGAKVNERDLRGWTALFYAVAFGHRSVAQLLIERGALVDIVDDDLGVTPLMLAAAAGHEIIVKELLQFGATISTESISGDTAKSLALKNGHINVKNLIDAHYNSKKRNQMPNVRCSGLFSLFEELQLTKYYHVFEKHEIDLSTFWLLTDNNLKEIGIQLLGPRKKMCLTISQYHKANPVNNGSKDVLNVENVLMENKKLHQLVEKMKSMILHEKTLRTAAEKDLADGLESCRNFSDAVQSSVNRAVNLGERLKESHEYVRNLLCNTLQSMNFYKIDSKPKVDLLLQSVDCMRKLIDIQHQNIVSVQKIDFQKYSNK